MGDFESRSPGTARTGGIPIVGPIRYPTGTKVKGRRNRRSVSGEGEVPGGAVRGGFPPGLCPQPPPVPYPKVPSKCQKMIQNSPVARLTDEEYKCVSGGLVLCTFLENTRGDTHLSDDWLYDKEESGRASHGKVFCAEARRVATVTYANKMSRDEWGERLHFGEVEADYTREGEFYDAVVRFRHPQYDVAEKDE